MTTAESVDAVGERLHPEPSVTGGKLDALSVAEDDGDDEALLVGFDALDGVVADLACDVRPVEKEGVFDEVDAREERRGRGLRGAPHPHDRDERAGHAEELSEEAAAEQEEERGGEHHERGHPTEAGVGALGRRVEVERMRRAAHRRTTRTKKSCSVVFSTTTRVSSAPTMRPASPLAMVPDAPVRENAT